jgi:chromosome segregation ATPase
MAIERIVTDDAVFEIADQLTANGEKVTNRAIWSAIGGGSMTTVSQSLRRWKEQQEIQVSQPIERTPLPASLVDVLHHAAAQLWETAQAETKAELEQLAHATNARIAEAQSERDDTLAELQTTAEELEQVKEERETALSWMEQILRESIDEADIKLNTQALAITEATHRADTAEAHRAELSARVEQLSQLLTDQQTAHQAEATELRAELNAHISATIQATSRADTAEATQAQLNKSLKAEQSEHKAEIATLRAALESVQAEKSKLEGMLTVYEAIGGSGALIEAKPAPAKTPTPRKVTKKKAEGKAE